VLGVTVLFTLLLRHSARISRSIAEPIENLNNRVQEIGGGDLTVRKPVESQVYEVSALSEGVEQMVEKMGNLMKVSTDRQESLRQAELALLQAQINPHFLYNTLDTIIWLIEAGKTEEAEEMVTDLSSFFRHSLSNGEDVVTLDDEEKQVRSYLQIQQFRYKDIMDYSIDIDNDIKGTRLPKLTIQPLVENALYHGVKLKRAKGLITVKGKAEGGDIVITVSDTGAGMTKDRLEELRAGLTNRERVGFGLSTVDERLKLFFGEKYGLSIESTEGEGTDVTVRIPGPGRKDDET
ncbi:MAG: sensor histidine kinase, partial [Clostridiales bacterium]|nr:sensor histidine kinase [Clostridiales bacterium]